jgi:Uma2 family endonuclease
MHGVDERGFPRSLPWTAERLSAAGGAYEDCELWDGLPVVRDPSGGPHDVVCARVIGAISAHAPTRAGGWVLASSAGFLVARDPDRVLSPDAAYVSRERMPRVPRRGFMECAPDLVVEVRSPDDAARAPVERCALWIAHGCLLAWAIDPQERHVTVLRPGAPAAALGPGEVLTGDPVLSHLRLPVTDLFVGL